MLYLTFQIGKDRYALATEKVVEVMPFVSVKEIPQATRGVAGAFVYQGNPVPLIDLAELATGQPSKRLMSTRIFLVEYAEPSGETHLVGLLAERATDTLSRQPGDFVEAGVAVDGAPYLGPVTMDSGEMIQRIEINQLLTAEVRDHLFRQSYEVS